MPAKNPIIERLKKPESQRDLNDNMFCKFTYQVRNASTETKEGNTSPLTLPSMSGKK